MRNIRFSEPENNAKSVENKDLRLKNSLHENVDLHRKIEEDL
jgi:hypothetical protein